MRCKRILQTDIENEYVVIAKLFRELILRIGLVLYILFNPLICNDAAVNPENLAKWLLF